MEEHVSYQTRISEEARNRKSISPYWLVAPYLELKPAKLYQRVQENALSSEKSIARQDEHGDDVVAPSCELLMRARGTEY